MNINGWQNNIGVELDLPMALRRNDALQSLHLNNITLVGCAPSIEGELRFLRTLKKCHVTHNVLLECIERHLQLNDGRMPNLKQLYLSRADLTLIAWVLPITCFTPSFPVASSAHWPTRCSR